MDAEKYLEEVLKSQTLGDDSEEVKAMQSERSKVETLLNARFKEGKPTIRYAGSYKKGTMILDNYDLDITCYFSSDDNTGEENLKEIYDNVSGALEEKYFIEKKKSSIRLKKKQSDNSTPLDFHIDVVPGRFTDESKGDVFLFQANGEKERLKTNLDKHIDHIKGSGVIDEIKLIKFWKQRNGLNVKTFILELLVVEVLKGRSSKGLEANLKKLWTAFRDEIDEIKIEDPANPSGNDLSEMFDASVKTALTLVASKTIKLIEADRWKDIYGEVEVMDKEEKAASLEILSRKNPNPPKPWFNIE